jgi:hypothetical protein
MNGDGFSDQKGDFVYICQNNNNLNVDVNAGATNNIDTLQEIFCTENTFEGLIVIGCTNFNDSTLDTDEDTTTTDDTISLSSNDNTEQPSVQQKGPGD